MAIQPLELTAPVAGAGHGRGRLGEPGASALGIGGMLALVAAAFGLMVWLTSDPVRRGVVAELIGSPMGLLVLFGLAAIASATLILPAPGLALTAPTGTAADPIVVGVVAGMGQAVGELTGYIAGASGRSILPDNPASRRITRWLRQRGLVVIFVLAALPNPLFDLAGIAAGVARIPVLHYLGAAASGKIVKNVVIAGGASALGGVVAIILVARLAP